MASRTPLFDQVDGWLRQATRQLEAEQGCFHLRSRLGDRIICQAVTDGLRATRLAYGLDLSDCPAVLEVLQSGEPLAIDNAPVDLRVAQVARERFGLRSVLYVPVRVRGAPEAVVIFSHRNRTRAWSAADVEQARALGRDAERMFSPSPIDDLAEVALQALMLQGIPGWVCLVDRQLITRASSASPRGETGGEERAPGSLRELLDDSDRGHELRQALQDLFAGDLGVHEALMRTPHATVWVRAAAVSPEEPMDDALVAVHVQELPEVEEALVISEERQRLESLGRIAGSVAHEFNNALQLIDLSLEELDGDRSRHAQRTIADASARAARVTSQLLTFARRAPSEFEPRDLRDVALDHLDLLQRAAGGEHPVELDLRHHATVQLDPRKMELALINLVRNAADASPGGTPIRIELEVAREDTREWAVLAVADQGPGIPPDVRRRLGQPQTSSKPAGLGTGLGLAVVKQVVDEHGGQVRIGSASEGGRVEIWLPLEAPPSGSETEPDVAGKPSLLVVEDEQALARIMKRNLVREGYRVELASSLASALRFFESSPDWADAVVIDLQLGDGSGLRLFRAARAVRPDLPFLAMSGYAEPETVLELNRGGCKVLSKPFTLGELTGELRRLLEGTDRPPPG